MALKNFGKFLTIWPAIAPHPPIGNISPSRRNELGEAVAVAAAEDDDAVEEAAVVAEESTEAAAAADIVAEVAGAAVGSASTS